MTTTTPLYKIIFFTQNGEDPVMADASFPINLPDVIAFVKTFKQLPLYFYITDDKGRPVSSKYYINAIVTDGYEDFELRKMIEEKQWQQAVKWPNGHYYFPFKQGKDRNLHII